jgi:hypothetical protein
MEKLSSDNSAPPKKFAVQTRGFGYTLQPLPLLCIPNIAYATRK